MSSTKYYWYGHIKKMLQRYPNKLDADHTLKSAEAKVAIERTLEDISKLPDGNDRLKFFDLYLFRQSHTLAGAALETHVSEKTAKNWNSDLVYRIAKYLGYL